MENAIINMGKEADGIFRSKAETENNNIKERLSRIDSWSELNLYLDQMTNLSGEGEIEAKGLQGSSEFKTWEELKSDAESIMKMSKEDDVSFPLSIITNTNGFRDCLARIIEKNKDE